MVTCTVYDTIVMMPLLAIKDWIKVCADFSASTEDFGG